MSQPRVGCLSCVFGGKMTFFPRSKTTKSLAQTSRYTLISISCVYEFIVCVCICVCVCMHVATNINSKLPLHHFREEICESVSIFLNISYQQVLRLAAREWWTRMKKWEYLESGVNEYVTNEQLEHIHATQCSIQQTYDYEFPRLQHLYSEWLIMVCWTVLCVYKPCQVKITE